MRTWLDLLDDVLSRGASGPDRTGVGTLSLFGLTAEFDNSDTFPAVTTKRLAFGQVCAELRCFLRGHDSLAQFHAEGCRVWDGNGAAWPGAREPGDLGRIYGTSWRRWRGLSRDGRPVVVDQLRSLVESLRRDPRGRRHLLTAWNPAELDQVCLPACHVLFQAYVRPDSGVLDARVDMRSVDLFLGLPFDVASYALLQRILAGEAGLPGTGRLVFHLGDAHVYLNHVAAAREVLGRKPRPAPSVAISPWPASVDDFRSAILVGYDPWPRVPAELNV